MPPPAPPPAAPTSAAAPHRARRRRGPGLAVVAVAGLGVLLGGVRAGRAADGDALADARRAHAAVLSALARTAREAKAGRLALRLYEDAHALDPAQDDARLALGWRKDGAAWRVPDGTVVPGEGWADDADAEAARLEKKAADARTAHRRDLVAAAAAARQRRAFAEADRLGWAAVALDPDDPEPRRLLGHREVAGRLVAPEHAALAGGLAAARAAWRAQARAAAGDLEPAAAPPPAPTVAGWPSPVGPGRRVGAVSAFTLGGATGADGVAARAAEAAALVAWAYGRAPAARGPAFLLVPSRDLADALLAADPAVDRASLPTARRWPVWPLGRTGYDLVVAPDVGEALGATVDAAAAREALVGGADRAGQRWVGFAAGFFATNAVLGAPRGLGATRLAAAGDLGPTIRDDETGLGYVRRLVALGADRPLEALAALDPRELRPADVAVAGALLDVLFLLDPARGRAFLGKVLAGADRAAAVAEGARAAGYPSVAALEDAFRRFVADLYPRPPRGAEGGAWKVSRLGKVPPPATDAVFGRKARAVAGSLWLAGRPYRCRPVEDGQAVELEPLRVGDPPRVVRKPGPVPFRVAREAGGGDVEVGVRLEREGAGWTAGAADAVAGVVDGRTLVFEDLDVDGRWGGFHRDGVVVDPGFTLPLEPTLVLDRKVVELRRVGPDGREVAWRTRPLAAAGEVLDALLRWNGWRRSCGLPGLDVDADAAAAAAADLKAGRPAADDDLGADAASVSAALEAWVLDPAARPRLLAPDATAVGFGVAGGRVVARLVRDPRRPAPGLPLGFPGPGAAGVPPRCPASVWLPAAADVDGTAVEAVVVGGPGSAPVPLPRTTPTGDPRLLVFAPSGAFPVRGRVTWRYTVPGRAPREATFETSD